MHCLVAMVVTSDTMVVCYSTKPLYHSLLGCMGFVPFPQLIPHSGKFSNGANFSVFRTCAKIIAYKIFYPRPRDNPILSHTATSSLLRHSRCPCKRGSLISSPWWWTKHAMRVKKLGLAQRVSQGLWFAEPEKNPINAPNFILTKILKSYENLHQRKLTDCSVLCTQGINPTHTRRLRVQG